MRSYKLLSIVLLLGVGVLFLSAPASAEVINTTTTTQLFYDSFEGLGTNVSHIAKPDLTGDYDPGTPPVGLSWNMTEATPEYGQVTDHVGVGDPGPAPGCGSNYLRMWRDTTPHGGSVQAEAFFTEQSTIGNVIHADMMVNITDNVNTTSYTGFSFNLFNAAITTRVVTFAANKNGEVSYRAPTNVWTKINGITWTEDQWQEWQVDYTIGSSSITLTIGDTTKTGNYAYSTGAVGSLIFGGGYPDKTPTYIDDVIPEPSTLALLVTGLIGLLAYAWRRRK